MREASWRAMSFALGFSVLWCPELHGRQAWSPTEIRVGASSLSSDPADSLHLLAASGGGLLESHDGGRSWHAIGPVIESERPSIVRIAPGGEGILYVAASSIAFPQSGLGVSTDGGLTWVNVLEPDLYEYFGFVVPDPIAPRTVYFGLIGANHGPLDYAGC